MSKAPAFQFYPSDWLSSKSVMLMTPAEEGAYIRLLAIAWSELDCGLPDDDEKLAKLSRLGGAWKRGSGEKIRKCFFSRRGRLFNKRLLEERKKQEEWKKKSSEGGKKSAKVRWGKHQKTGEGKGGYKSTQNDVQNCEKISENFSGNQTEISKKELRCKPENDTKPLPDANLMSGKGGYEMVTDSLVPKGNSSFSSSSSSTTKTRNTSLSEKVFSDDSVEVKLAEFFIGLLDKRGYEWPKNKKPDVQRWAVEFDKLIRIDGRSPERIRAVIEWVQRDPFWQSNVLSPAKLREKWGQLTEKMKHGTNRKHDPSPDGPDGPEPGSGKYNPRHTAADYGIPVRGR